MSFDAIPENASRVKFIIADILFFAVNRYLIWLIKISADGMPIDENMQIENTKYFLSNRNNDVADNFSGRNRKIASKPSEPIINVTDSWLKLPAVLSNNPFILLEGERTIILPANSPVLLGVIIPRLTPINMDFINCSAGIFSSFSVRILHLIISIPQLMGIRINTSESRLKE